MESSQNCQNTYLIYTRKSTDDADNQKNSIAYQKAEAIRYANQEVLPLANIDINNFCAKGIIVERHTGFKESERFSIDKHGVQHNIERPKFHKLAEFLWKGHFKGVIFLCWDRASRNKSDNAIIERLISRGSDIRFVQTRYDDSSSGKLHMDIDGTFAQHFSRVISEKVRNTNRKLRDDGICTYRAPIGYLNTGDPRNKPFDQQRAPIVKHLFEKYAEGTWSLADLARWANEQGLTMPPVRRKRTKEEMLQEDEIAIEPVTRPITVNHIHTILRSPFYIGKIKGNDRCFVQSSSHEPLITEHLFQIVQRMLHSKNVSIHYIEKLNFPYRGLIRCAHCNRVFSPYEQKNIHYYGARCVNGCSNTKRNVNASFIEERVGGAIKSLYYSEKEIAQLNRKLHSDVSILEVKRMKELEQIERQQKKIREELAYLQNNKLTLLRTGTYTPEDFLVQETTLVQNIGELSAKIEASGTSLREIMKDLLTLSELLKEAYLYYYLTNPDEKQQFITLVFSELKFSGETLLFQCKNGFKVLKDHSFVLGAPKTWLSELLESKSDIRGSITDLEYLIGAYKSTSDPP